MYKKERNVKDDNSFTENDNYSFICLQNYIKDSTQTVWIDRIRTIAHCWPWQEKIH